MVWFIMPIVLGEGTIPISAPTGVPALGDTCFWGGRSRSCCSTILAARSATYRNNYVLTSLHIKELLHPITSSPLTFILCFLGSLEVPPLGAHQSTQFPKGEIWVSSLDDCPHFTAEQDVATHVDLPLGPFLLWQALHFRCGLHEKKKKLTRLVKN